MFRLFRKRPPDFIIGTAERLYMLRWYLLPRNRWFNVYLHKIVRDDDDRALHDHPWWSLSIILSGAYCEHTTRGTEVYSAPWFRLRSSRFAHRLEVVNGPVWTLFITGPRVREWGFHCPKGWIPWQEFCDSTNHGNVGRGCGED